MRLLLFFSCDIVGKRIVAEREVCERLIRRLRHR